MFTSSVYLNSWTSFGPACRLLAFANGIAGAGIGTNICSSAGATLVNQFVISLFCPHRLRNPLNFSVAPLQKAPTKLSSFIAFQNNRHLIDTLHFALDTLFLIFLLDRAGTAHSGFNAHFGQNPELQGKIKGDKAY